MPMHQNNHHVPAPLNANLNFHHQHPPPFPAMTQNSSIQQRQGWPGGRPHSQPPAGHGFLATPPLMVPPPQQQQPPQQISYLPQRSQQPQPWGMSMGPSQGPQHQQLAQPPGKHVGYSNGNLSISPPQQQQPPHGVGSGGHSMNNASVSSPQYQHYSRPQHRYQSGRPGQWQPGGPSSPNGISPANEGQWGQSHQQHHQQQPQNNRNSSSSSGGHRPPVKKTRKLEVGRKGLVEDVVNLLSAGQSADGQPRGSTTSAVKTKQDKDSGTRSQPVVMNGASATSSSGSGETTLFCEPCEKEFASEAAHKAHLLSHVPCPEVGCNFSASRKVISAHHSATHGRFSGSGFQAIEVEGRKFRVLLGTCPEEVQQWREARRKRWPTEENMARKAEDEKKRRALGGLSPDSGPQGRGGRGRRGRGASRGRGARDRGTSGGAHHAAAAGARATQQPQEAVGGGGADSEGGRVGTKGCPVDVTVEQETLSSSDSGAVVMLSAGAGGSSGGERGQGEEGAKRSAEDAALSSETNTGETPAKVARVATAVGEVSCGETAAASAGTGGGENTAALGGSEAASGVEGDDGGKGQQGEAEAGGVEGGEGTTGWKRYCSFYLRGKCNKGEECTFSHDVQRRNCSYFTNGRCYNGKKCTFIHDKEAKAQAQLAASEGGGDASAAATAAGSFKTPNRVNVAPEASKPTLLRKLLAPQLHRERSISLQAVRFIVASNFFLDPSKGQPAAPVEATSSSMEDESRLVEETSASVEAKSLPGEGANAQASSLLTEEKKALPVENEELSTGENVVHMEE